MWPWYIVYRLAAVCWAAKKLYGETLYWNCTREYTAESLRFGYLHVHSFLKTLQGQLLGSDIGVLKKYTLLTLVLIFVAKLITFVLFITNEGLCIWLICTKTALLLQIIMEAKVTDHSSCSEWSCLVQQAHILILSPYTDSLCKMNIYIPVT